MTGHDQLWVSLVTSIPGILTALGGLVWTLRRIREVHTIVNSQRAAMEEKIAQLEALLAERK